MTEESNSNPEENEGSTAEAAGTPPPPVEATTPPKDKGLPDILGESDEPSDEEVEQTVNTAAQKHQAALTAADEEAELLAVELDALKERATKLEIKFHPNIGYLKLKEKVDAVIADSIEAEPNLEPAKEKLVDMTARERALALVRVRVVCMDPMKKEFSGDTFTAGNGVVNTQRRYVAFDVPWHAPRIIVNFIKGKQHMSHTTVTSARGIEVKTRKMVDSYVVQELDPLTKVELKELAQRQLMRSGSSDALDE